MTTNLEYGVTNNNRDNVLGHLKVPDPTISHTYFDDFDTYSSPNWIVTSTDPGVSGSIVNEDGGILMITNTADDDDLVALQLAREIFKFEAGKSLLFKARFKISDAIQSDFVIGLQINDTTPLAVTDGVYFRKDDGDANLDFVIVKDSAATTASAITTLTSDTYMTVGFYFDGNDYVNYFASTDTLAPTFLGRLAITNLPNDEVLTISFALQNGEAVAKTMSIDYILASKER